MDIMDFLDADAELQAAIWMLKEVTDLPECQTAENGFADKYSPQVFVYAQSIIKCKRQLGKSILKKDKQVLQLAKERMQKYILTVDRDEQIKILKFVQPD
jgi:hypothetical protein